jgi:hypothetical protein
MERRNLAVAGAGVARVVVGRHRAGIAAIGAAADEQLALATFEGAELLVVEPGDDFLVERQSLIEFDYLLLHEKGLEMWKRGRENLVIAGTGRARRHGTIIRDGRRRGRVAGVGATGQAPFEGTKLVVIELGDCFLVERQSLVEFDNFLFHGKGLEMWKRGNGGVRKGSLFVAGAGVTELRRSGR